MSKNLFLAIVLPIFGCVSETDRNIEMLRATVEPILSKALAEVQLDAASFSASAQAINPNYKGTFTGLWVTGIIGEVSFGLDGVSGQMSGATQGANR